MVEIKFEIIQKIAVVLAGALVAAMFAGLALIRLYEEFRKGVEKKSKLRVWFSFVGLSFLILFPVFFMRVL